MPNRVNTMMLSEFTERYRNIEYMIAVGYEGLDVQSTNALRNEFAGKNMTLRLVKNRIVRMAFKELGITGVEAVINGQTAFVVGDDPVAMARTIRDFAKEHKQLVFRGAVIENTVLDEKQALGLADAASKEELQGSIAGALLSGGANIGAALLGSASKIAGCIKSLVEKLEEKTA